jgi:hypothetical protein
VVVARWEVPQSPRVHFSEWTHAFPLREWCKVLLDRTTASALIIRLRRNRIAS